MGARRRCGHIWQFLKQVYREYTGDNCPLMAAAISFYVLLSLIPLLLVALSTFGYVLGPERRVEAVSQFLGQFLPEEFGGEALKGYLKANIYQRRVVVGWLGIITWVWTASISLSTVTQALNIAWEAPRRRNFLVNRLLSIALMLVVGVLGLVSFATTSALKIVQGYQISWSPVQPGQFPVIWQIAGWVLPAALSILIFVLCYTVLPEVRVGVRSALLGAVVGGVLWEAAKQGFAYYIANLAGARYDMIYGPLGGLVILVMWVYYSAAILLLGAEVASVSATRKGAAPR